jgi:uncharacterized protein YndB with AHSA1/START domain
MIRGVQTISVEVRSRAPRERVWSLLADTASWAEWAPFDEANLERPGNPEPEGVGAIRAFRVGRKQTRERVVAFEPPERFSYEHVSGLPIRGYRADVTVTSANDGGTAISWESRFRGKFPVPGRFVQPRLEEFVRRTAEALARAAER